MCFREEMNALNSKQNSLLESWKLQHLTEDQIHAKVHRLKEKQTVLVTEENYAEAAEIDQQISDLLEQHENYKYQHPVLDEQVYMCIVFFNLVLASNKHHLSLSIGLLMENRNEGHP